VTQHISVKSKLTNRSCSQWRTDMLKWCVFKLRRKEKRGHRLIGVADYFRREAQHCGMPDWWMLSDGYWGRDDSSCHSSIAVLLQCKAEAGLPVVRALNISSSTLYSIRSAISSPWSQASTGVMCSDRLVQVTMHAIEFWAHCSFWMLNLPVPWRMALQ